MATLIAAPPPPPTLPGVIFRRWRGPEDIDGMAAANERLRTACGVLEPVTPDEMRHDYAHLEGSDPARDVIVVEREGSTVGYCRVEWHDLTDGDRIYDATIVVDPAHAGHGIAASLLAWCEARERQLAREHPTDRRAWHGMWTFDGDTEAIGATLDAGYDAVRLFADMLRPSLDDPLPTHPLAPGYRFTALTAEDLPAVWDMLVLSFIDHFGEYVEGEVGYQHFAESPRRRPDLDVAAVAEDGTIASIVLIVLEEQPDGSVRGLMDGVATHPAHRRLGLARACLGQALRVVREHGCTSAYLGVDVGNANAAMELYASCGFEAVATSHAYRRPFDPSPETMR